MLSYRNKTGTLPDTGGSEALEISHIASTQSASDAVQGPVNVAIIDRRALGRETLKQALTSADDRFQSQAFADVGEWERSSGRCDTSLILLECGSVSQDRPSLEDDLQGLVEAHPDIPVIAMGEDEDPHHVSEILARGARGYIPTSVSLIVAIGALYLALAGGTFVPAGALQSHGRGRPEHEQSVQSVFGLSERQASVADAVVLGKPNKVIAHELELSESTVKVHIRAIMRKLQARNRTEVAFKLQAAKSDSHASRRVRSAGRDAA